MDINLPNWISLSIVLLFMMGVGMASFLAYVVFFNSAGKLIDEGNKKKPNQVKHID